MKKKKKQATPEYYILSSYWGGDHGTLRVLSRKEMAGWFEVPPDNNGIHDVIVDTADETGVANELAMFHATWANNNITDEGEPTWQVLEALTV